MSLQKANELYYISYSVLEGTLLKNAQKKKKNAQEYKRIL